MKKSIFTEEELKEMRLADEEIERSFSMTPEDWKRSKDLDKQSKRDRLDNKGRRIAAQQAAYREANREKIAAQQAAYREANREKIAAQQAAYREANREKIAAKKAAYYEANREKRTAYQRDYNRRKRLLAQQYEKEAASEAGTFESGKGVPQCS